MVDVPDPDGERLPELVIRWWRRWRVVQRRSDRIVVTRMRQLLMLSLLLVVAVVAPARADPPIPALTGRVVDAASVLSESTINIITSQLKGYEAATTNQVVVVTLPDLKAYTIDTWGLALGRSWGIGQKGKDNGVLLIVAPRDRQLRIEVGYGLEGQLPDATADKIIRAEIVPRFKAGDLDGGVIAGVNGILAALGGNYTPSAVETSQDDGIGIFLAEHAGFILIGLVLIVYIVSHIRRKYDPARRRNVFYWHDDPRSYSSGSSSSSSGFSSGGFSHSSGGGFSGGGGSFGGGGASGRW
jgi:uncharacterized protein